MNERYTLKKGEILRVRGPARVTLKTGRIQIGGSDRSRFIIKEGKTCTVEGIQQSRVEIKLGTGGEMYQQGNVPVAPRIWLKYAHEILQNKGTIMILGAPDTGKTTFTTFLANQALEKGIFPAVLDSDIGQSDIGPPTTIGLAFPTQPMNTLSDVEADEVYFIGTTSVHQVCDMVVGLQYLTQKAQKRSDLVIIDTCGYVHGDTGRRLKHTKLQAIRPDMVVALQIKEELRPILRSWRGTIINVSVPTGIKKVPRRKRKEIRQIRWCKALSQAQDRQVDLEEKTLLNTYLLSGKKTDKRLFKKLLHHDVLHAEEIPEGFFLVKKDTFHEYQSPAVTVTGNTLKTLDAGWEQNLVVGLLRDTICVDIGIIKKINYTSMMAVIACKEHDFDSISFGRVKVDESGYETGFIPWC
jgi:polynucleotide 5'-hydroxyl-kinase GRC3/NOL9